MGKDTKAAVEAKAATVIQKWARRFLVRKNLNLKFTQVGENITSLQMALSKLLSPTTPLVFSKSHEIMVTRVRTQGCEIKLVSNQGTPDAMRKFFANEGAKTGAVINGGFYAINGFYELRTNSPIGLHRFSFNYSNGPHSDVIKKDFDNTQKYFEHKENDISPEFEEYKGKDLESRLHLKTQTPYAMRDQYGVVKITYDGKVDIRRMSNFTNRTFAKFLSDAKEVFSSGPFLTLDGETVFKEEMLKEKPYQFQQVKAYFGTHPGSVPPGTFYHADQPNPRSAIGLAANGDLLMVTVKGEEDPSHRDGLTLAQFAELMKLLGAKTALNLDGGYSACHGVFNETMLTPLFVKKAGREKLIPYGIMAIENKSEEENLSEQENKSVPNKKAPKKKIPNKKIPNKKLNFV
ncbi:MAG: phosphodiester glycosidase family protein [Proteobacteria bacterium]|nr:phosphodiester glycosidase family protein [Pseudomonadota bacterium]